MGIPSLKSAILYKLFSLYFTIKILRYRSGWQSHAQNDRVTLRMTPKSCKYNHRPRKLAYVWPTSLFLTPRPRKGPFFWPPFVHFRSRPRKQPFSWTAGSFFRSRPRNLAFLWTGDEKSISMRDAWLYSHQVRVWWKIFPYLARSPLRVKGIW